MPSNDTGRLSDIITNVQELENITDFTERTTQLRNYIDMLDSVEDVSTVLSHDGISEDLARAALGQSRNFADNAENIMSAISASSDAVDNLGQNLSQLPSQATGLAGIAGKLKAAFEPLLSNPFTLLTIGAAVAGTVLYNYITAFDKAVEKTQESQAAYSQAAAEVSSLNSELEQVQSKINALESKGSLTLTEEAELNRLRMQNTELQRQLDLKQQIAEEKSTATVKDAVKALEYERTTDLTYGQKVNGTVNTAKRNTNIITATENEIAALEGLKKERKEVLEKYNNTKDETQKKKYASELESLDESIDTYSSAIQENIGEITELRKSFIDSSTGLMKEGLNAKEQNHYKNMTSVIDQYGSMGSSAEEKQSKAMQSYFSIPGSSLIEDQLRSMAELADLTAEDITRMGIAIDGVDAQTIANHFNEMAASAKEAADATTKFGTLSEYEKALQSENAGDDYLKIANGLKNAKDLYDKGLIGTDDFTSYAKMLSPSGADDPESFMQNYERFQTYFNTDSREGIDAFVSDLSKKTNEAGEAFAAFDESTGKWSFNIKDTAEAAKEFQMGIAPFEALLGRLKDYGFDIDFQSSLETLEETQTAVGGFDEILDRMAEGDRKDALQKQLEGWRGNLSEWQEDISTLDTDIVMQIKMQYSLAEIQAQIDELRSLIDEGADTVENRAALNAGNQRYIDTAEENLGFNTEGFEIPIAYSSQEEQIEELRNQLQTANSDEKKLEIQTEITNQQEIQKQFLDEFASQHPKINAESNLEEIQAAWDNFFSIPQHLKIDAELDESAVYSALWELPTGSSITYNANVDGVRSTVSAFKDENGNIKYVADVGDVRKTLYPYQNEDGTVHYYSDFSGVGSPPPLTSTITYYSQTVGEKLESPVVKRVFYGGSFNGTAHANGSWGVSHSHRALVGELGTETLVRGSRFQTIGERGAEFINLRKGDIIFNHKQTAELFKNGYVTSGGGRAKVFGSFANGSAYAGGSYSGFATGSTAALPSKDDKDNKLQDWLETYLDEAEKLTDKLVDACKNAVGLAKKQEANSKALSQVQAEIRANKEGYNTYMAQADRVGLSASYAEKVRNGSLAIESISDENLSEKIKSYEEWYKKARDCEKAIRDLEEQERDLALERLENISDYFDSLIDVNKSLQDMNDAKLELNDNMGFSNTDSKTKDIINSSIRAEESKYADLAKKLSDYQAEFNDLVKKGYLTKGSEDYLESLNTINEFNEELLESASALVELQDKLREVDYTSLGHVIDMLDRTAERLENSADLTEAKGEKVSESQLRKQLDNANAQIQKQYKLRQAKLNEQAYYAVNSARYQEIADDIADIDDTIFGALENIEELKDAIWEVRWQPFFDAQDEMEDLISETDDLRKLLNDDAFIGKNGELTADGAAALALMSQGMNTAKQQIRDYQEAIKKLDNDLKNNNISTAEYAEQQKDFLDAIRKSVDVVEDYKDEIIDLWKEQLRAENDVIQESIDKHKELLRAKKDNDNYSRDIRSQTKEINAIKAQMQALSGVNNESAKAELKRLQAELLDAEDSLAETRRDREDDIRSQGYDTLSNNLDQALQDTLDEVTYNANKQEEVISHMLDNVVSRYQDAYGKIQSIISGTGFTPGAGLNNNLNNLGTQSGAQSQTDKSNTAAPDYTPGASVGNIHTGAIVGKPDSDKNSAIETEIKKEPNTANRPIAEIKLSSAGLSLIEGNTGALSVTIRPTDAANQTLKWTSSNVSVASVTNGTVKALTPGSAVITCSATDGSGKSASCKVTVSKKPEPPKPAAPSKPVTSQGNGVPEIGDRVRYNSGIYYETSYGKGKWGSRNRGEYVYITNINWGAPNPIHISTGSSLHNGDRGWLTQGQISGYAAGTRGITNPFELARIDEQGKELRIKRGSSRYDMFQYGDGVVPAGLTDNLFTLAENKNALMASVNRTPHEGMDLNISNHYDSLLTVNGNVDKDALPPLKELLKLSYDNTVKNLVKDAGLMGMKLKR